jgi:hypothetical protein
MSHYLEGSLDEADGFVSPATETPYLSIRALLELVHLKIQLLYTFTMRPEYIPR